MTEAKSNVRPLRKAAATNESASSDREVSNAEKHRLTELGNSERMALQHGDKLRYVPKFGKWFLWDGRRWKADETDSVTRHAKETVRSIYQEANKILDRDERKAIAKHAVTSETAKAVRAMISLASSESNIVTRHDAFDSDPWVLNVNNGTIDLRNGELKSHRREDLHTKLAPVDYCHEAACPTFDAFLAQILPDEGVRDFVQKLAGICLTGTTTEHILPVFWGSGSNGKSTLLDALQFVLGEYATQIPSELLIEKRAESHPTERTTVLGVRLAVACETRQNGKLNEGLVKAFTGGDRISARYIGQDFFEFSPTHKLILCTNHKPQIVGTDEGIWRRVHLVPFAVTITDDRKDKLLKDKLRAESSGILRWAVAGCLRWQAEGLVVPEAVRVATSAYRDESDTVKAFLTSCCDEASSANREHVRESAKKLYAAYESWARENGEIVLNQRAFGIAMSERGFERRKVGTYVYLGVRLRSESEIDRENTAKPTLGTIGTMRTEIRVVQREVKNSSYGPETRSSSSLSSLRGSMNPEGDDDPF